MWTFVGNKNNKQWLWLALNPVNRQIIAFHVGGRGNVDAQLFYEKIPEIFKGNAGLFSDYWQSYVKTFENENHFGVGKSSGLTAYIERFNGTLRQRVLLLDIQEFSQVSIFKNIIHYSNKSFQRPDLSFDY